MTGMKEGPGEDPFAEDTTDEQDDPALDPTPETTAESQTESESDSTDSMSTDEIPYVIRRQTVKEDRDNEHVAFLRDEYAELEDQVRADVADELDMRSKDISVTDLREAFVELAAENPDTVASILESWGYEHLK
ncbi:hypothetical protein [Haloarcula sp. CBA1127]|uniref:hypothetical protein n=1 Tax=Haloarcula sp. CBA1127 TaxID=1765055 RepID=UPI00073F7BFF|nr:hypothetical protein [Haloarcula sp. CBA1127]